MASIINKSELMNPIIFNIEILHEIIDEFYEIQNENESDENKYKPEFIDEIHEIISNESDIYFYDSENNRIISYKESYDKLEYLRIRYDIISSYSSYSLKNLLELFNEIIELYNSYFRQYEIKNNVYHDSGMKYNNESVYELIEYIISEIDSKLFKNKSESFQDSEIILNVSDSYLYYNDMITFNNNTLNDEIYSILFESDLYSSCLYDLYDSGILDISYDENIDEIELFNDAYIEFLNYELTENIEYIRYDSEYESEILKLRLKDLLKLNESLSENDKYKLNFNIKKIDELTESVNNNLSDTFLYGIYDNITESLYSEPEYYYELYKINSKYFRFMKINSIFELIEIILNELKHYNLNNSFKFNESVYELY